MCFVYLYETATINPLEIVLRRWGGMRRMMEGANLTKVHYRHRWKCVNEIP
jgi:hypothetical protein